MTTITAHVTPSGATVIRAEFDSGHVAIKRTKRSYTFLVVKTWQSQTDPSIREVYVDKGTGQLKYAMAHRQRHGGTIIRRHGDGTYSTDLLSATSPTQRAARAAVEAQS